MKMGHARAKAHIPLFLSLSLFVYLHSHTFHAHLFLRPRLTPPTPLQCMAGYTLLPPAGRATFFSWARPKALQGHAHKQTDSRWLRLSVKRRGVWSAPTAGTALLSLSLLLSACIFKPFPVPPKKGWGD